MGNDLIEKVIILKELIPRVFEKEKNFSSTFQDKIYNILQPSFLLP